MNVSFTGTSRGMTRVQKRTVHGLLKVRWTVGAEFHHGDCIGADAEAAAIARLIGYTLVSHPPTNPKVRAFVASDRTCKPRPYLRRNHDIVDATDLLIAAPAQFDEILRSGTWATVRYGRKRLPSSAVRVVLPNGRRY